MSPLDVRKFRNTLGRFVTGVTVVTCEDGAGVKFGFTANSFSSISLDPPLVLVCISRNAMSHEAFLKAPRFAINILAEDQRDISGTFASRGGNKFEQIRLQTGVSKSPVVEGVAAWLDCDAHQTIEMGDHTLLIGRVVDFAYEDRTPLGYYAGAYVSFGAERYASDVPDGAVAKVGAILRHENLILLLKDESRLLLPTASFLGEHDRKAGSLFKKLAEVNIEARLDFIYSVSHDPENGNVNLYYRGKIVPPVEIDLDRAVLVPLESVPWDRIPSSKYRMMLERYVREAHQTRFGVYYGSTRSGSIESLAPMS